jgi:hypothetical protein
MTNYLFTLVIHQGIIIQRIILKILGFEYSGSAIRESLLLVAVISPDG